VLDVFALGRVRSRKEIEARLDAVGPLEVRRAFARMLAERPAVAIAGKLKKGCGEGRALFDERCAVQPVRGRCTCAPEARASAFAAGPTSRGSFARFVHHTRARSSTRPSGPGHGSGVP
jgi:hypothetical protein